MNPTPVKEERVDFWLGNRHISFAKEEVDADPQLKDELEYLWHQNLTNPIQFFSPHGEAKYGTDCGFQLISSLNYLSDDVHTFFMNVSPNQVGKTCHAIVKKVLRLVPNQYDWSLIKELGVYYRPWEGPKTLVVLGYDKGQIIDVLWPELQKWIPDGELGEYRSFANGGTKSPSWQYNPRVNLKCGSRIIFLTYEMKPSVCAGVKAKEVLADEQMPLSFFNELDQRGRTLGGINWDVSFTPHRVVGRPDTGAECWLYDMWTGKNTRGHRIGRFRITVEEVPDHIYSLEQKQLAKSQWITIPRETGDEEAIREGEARFYGLFQRPQGLFYPEVNPELHFIDWGFDDIKDKAVTFFRTIDYGYANPTACSYWAVFSTGEYFLYDLYYVKGLDAIPHSRAIVERSGNKLKEMKKFVDKVTKIEYTVLSEECTTVKFRQTWLDWHCFSQQGGAGQPISFFFNIGGLRVLPSTKLNQEQRAQALRSFLRVDPERRHLVTGQKGAPRMYISKNCKKWEWEWERLVFESRRVSDMSQNKKETHVDKNDHAIDTTEYMACSGARYMPPHLQKSITLKPLSSSAGY